MNIFVNEKLRYIKHARKVLKNSLEEKGPYQISFLNKKFVVLPGVFSPKYFNDSFIFAKHLPNLKEKSVLEIGCGIGILSIFSIWKSARKVLAVDINNKAVQNTKINVKKYDLSDKIFVKRSNIFSSIKDKFDVIIWNLPFIYVKKAKLDLNERSIFDSNYKNINKLLSNSGNYLNEGGYLLLGFSSTLGDLTLLRKISKENNFKMELISRIKPKKISFELYKFVRS